MKKNKEPKIGFSAIEVNTIIAELSKLPFGQVSKVLAFIESICKKQIEEQNQEIAEQKKELKENNKVAPIKKNKTDKE